MKFPVGSRQGNIGPNNHRRKSLSCAYCPNKRNSFRVARRTSSFCVSCKIPLHNECSIQYHLKLPHLAPGSPGRPYFWGFLTHRENISLTIILGDMWSSNVYLSFGNIFFSSTILFRKLVIFVFLRMEGRNQILWSVTVIFLNKCICGLSCIAWQWTNTWRIHQSSIWRIV